VRTLHDLRELPKGGVSLRFWLEPLGPHTQDGKRVIGRRDLIDCLPRCRWALIFCEGSEIRGFGNLTAAKDYCRERWDVTEWSRDRCGDWNPEDGDSWISNRGELWPGKAPVPPSPGAATEEGTA
jgi:hypothetical protein